MRQRKLNLNTYLFANIVVLCLLLLSLWRGRPVIEHNISLSGLLVILVVLNTILLFREGLMRDPKQVSRPSWPDRIATLRRTLQNATGGALPGRQSDAVTEAVTALHVTVETQALLVLKQEETGHFSPLAQVGQPPLQWSAARLFLAQDNLALKHPGALGEETLHPWSTLRHPQRFVSKVTRLRFHLMPLALPHPGRAVLIVFPRPGHALNATLLCAGTLFLEGFLALDYARKTGSDSSRSDTPGNLLRHDHFQDSFETEIERSERYHQQMTLMQTTVGSFENLSATQQTAVQQSVATALHSSLRRLDLMFCGARPGTFTAILTETNQEIAHLVAERVVAAFHKQIPRKSELHETSLTIHIGTATYPIDATHGDGLREKSEEALQHALEHNQIIVSFGTMHGTEEKPIVKE